MKNICYIFFLLLTISCRFDNQQSEILDNCNFRAVNYKKNVNYNFSNLTQEPKMVGNWRSKSYWIKKDSIWNGFKSIDISHEYEFKDNQIFYYRAIKNGNILSCSKQGKYDIEIDSNYLILFTNNKFDTIFHQGDTVDIEKILIYSFNDSILRLGECHFTDCEEKEFVEYKKY